MSFLRSFIAFFVFSVLLSIPVIVVIFTELDKYIFLAHVLISTILFLWMVCDSESRNTAKNDGFTAPLLSLPILWYPSLYILIFNLSFKKYDGTPEKYALPNEDQIKIAEVLIKKGLYLSRKNQEVFGEIENQDYKSINKYYINKLLPQIEESERHAQEILCFMDRNIDFRSIEVSGTSLYEFNDWYRKKNILITENIIDGRLFIDHNENLIEYFGVPKLLFSPPVDFEKYLQKKKNEKTYSSSWEILVSGPFKKAFRKLAREVQNELLPSLEAILLNPLNSSLGKCKPLSHDKKGLWRYRVGDYRVLYSPLKNRNLIIFIDVTTRDKVYRSIGYK